MDGNNKMRGLFMQQLHGKGGGGDQEKSSGVGLASLVGRYAPELYK